MLVFITLIIIFILQNATGQIFIEARCLPSAARETAARRRRRPPACDGTITRAAPRPPKIHSIGQSILAQAMPFAGRRRWDDDSIGRQRKRRRGRMLGPLIDDLARTGCCAMLLALGGMPPNCRARRA